MPLISVILPFKNEQRYLKACLESLAKQSLSDFEVHMVDDHSTDSSRQIAQEYSARDPRFTAHSNPGKGIIDALSKALVHCSGKLLCRMDGDDLMPTDKLADLSRVLLKHGKGHISVGLTSYFSEQKISEGYQNYQNWLHRIHRENSFADFRFKECVIPSCAWMMYREDFLESLPRGKWLYPEDYHLMLEWFDRGFKVLPVPEIVHHWRDHDQRSSKLLEDYQISRFFHLKLHYILPAIPQKSVVVWGKGKRTDVLRKILREAKVAYHQLYDASRAKDTLMSMCHNNDVAILCTLGAGTALKSSRTFFETLGLKINQDFFLL